MVNFHNQFDEKVYFDNNGEPVPLYDIINWQKDSKDEIRFLYLSVVLHVLPAAGRPHAEESPNAALTVCPVQMERSKLLNVYTHISMFCVTKGSTECTKCPEYFWSDKEKVKCVAGEEEFLSFYDTMGIILVALTLLGFILTSIITIIFHSFRNTPIVKANNSEISFLLLLSLKLCFLCSLVFIGQPSWWTCRLRQVAFGISFVLCLSCLLVKTIVVLLAFRTSISGSRGWKLFGTSQQRILIICTTAPQVGRTVTVT
ncbi:extracellular calcium-sensing receptor-like [Simochromis diagramma]|uniref:extracellular calcium-sensing receptor-like n=1 Tax=Simochromis diagramma TaxID=43689 RepID=UPI001A7E34B8|nr:extracellular calcium-sensing receptor-like [Simochromis diagramma]